MDDEAFWCICFSTVVGWQFHPGRNQPVDGITIEGCALVADKMLAAYRERRRLWELSSEQLPPV